MKKVLFILNDFAGGGAERVFVNLANGFAASNIPVSFLAGKKEGVYLGLLHPSIPVAEVGGTSFVKYFTSFPSIFKKEKYTHIFTASDYVSSAAILAKKVSGIEAKIYATIHHTLPPNRPLKYWKGDLLLKAMHYFITPHADKIVAVSNGTLAWLKKISHHALPQSMSIYNPVFDDSIYGLAKENIHFPTNISGKEIIVSAGRLVEQKDPFTLLEAFKILHSTHPNVLLFMLGQGALHNSLQAYISKNNLQQSVFLMGFEANPYKWMAACNVFVLSSISEGLPLVLVEAMALGKTVVSTNCPSGPAEILQDGALGYLCAIENPGQLAAAMIKGLQAPFDSNQLIAAAQQYQISGIVKKYISIL